MTSSPSLTPSLIPSNVPSSQIPSASPTITGSVVFVDMNKIVFETLTENEIADIITSAEDAFGVYPGDVQAEVSYDITGSMIIVADDSDYSEKEIVSSLQETIAETLNVHPSDVSISIDPESGIVTYSISSATAEEAALLQEALSGTTNDVISSAIVDEIDAISSVPNNLNLAYH